MEVPRLGVKLELWAYAIATAMGDLSCVCDLYHSSQPRQILNPLSEARDRTHILMDTSRVCFQLSHTGNSLKYLLIMELFLLKKSAQLKCQYAQ